MLPSTLAQIRLEFNPQSPKLRMTLCSFYLDAGIKPTVRKLDKMMSWIGVSYEEHMTAIEKAFEDTDVDTKPDSEADDTDLGGGYV